MPDSATVQVPFFAQQTDHCGPAALSMLLVWSGVDTTPADLGPELWLPERRGTVAPSLVAAARRNDRLAVPVTSLVGILTELAAGHPVLVLQDVLPGPATRWHYAVVTGYEQANQQLRLHSGSQPDLRVDFGRFSRSWAEPRWALVVLPPGELPAAADARATLTAIVGLEQANRFAPAALSYERATVRWPEQAAAWLGLGNTRYQLGELEAAGAAFERATQLAPDDDAAFHNLASVRLEQGRSVEAQQAIERGLRINGPQRARLLLLRRAVLAR